MIKTNEQITINFFYQNMKIKKKFFFVFKKRNLDDKIFKKNKYIFKSD